MKTQEKNNEIIANETEDQMENCQLDQNEFAEKLAEIISNQKSVNMLLLKGFIASDVKTFNYGTWEKYSFTLGVSERKWNGTTVEFYTQYLPITLTSTLADIVGKQYKKGNEIIVLATIRRSVRDVDGQKKVYYDLKANDLYSADRAKTAMVA